MSPPTPDPESPYVVRSRRLIHASRACIATAREVLQHARQALARSQYRTIVCAWCGQTMRFERCPAGARGAVSHSMGFDCFAPMFPELAPGAARQRNAR
jgi:hypothetical protein